MEKARKNLSQGKENLRTVEKDLSQSKNLSQSKKILNLSRKSQSE